MKILFSTGGLFYLPIKDVFLLSKDTGFDGCDLVIDGSFNDMHHLDKVLECLEILPIYSIHAPYMKMKAWGTTAEALVRTIEIARRVGARTVNFHPPSWYSMELEFYKWFRRVPDFQRDFGCDKIFLAIETMPLLGKRLMLASFVLNNYKDLIKFGLERNLYFTLDTTHLGTFDEDQVEVLLTFLGTKRLKNIHLSDYGDFRSHRFLGRGTLPLVRLLNTAGRMGYDEMVTLEVSPYELPRARTSLEKMMQYQVSFIKLHLGKERDE